MSELLYFSFADLMIRVEYNEEANSLRYASHRKLTFNERLAVEQYLLASFAQKTDYYKRHPAFFIYLGLEAQLSKDLNLYHLKNTLKTLVEKEQDVRASVDGLINQSMQNYYFEQIGDTILALRQEIAQGVEEDRLRPLRRKMEELVEAYNVYAEHKISVSEVIPAELQAHLGLTSLPQAGAKRVAGDGVE